MIVKRAALLSTTLLLCLAAVVIAALAPRIMPFSIPDEYAIIAGSICGLVAVLLALRTNSRLSARTAVVLAFLATIMVGPAAAFTILLGLLNGLGGLMALVGSSGEAGMGGVGFQAGTLLAMAMVSIFGFMSQAWALLRAYKTLAKSP
ncbi:hypothetical protein [Chelativorans salis]|uniref:Uncharacterized protein n=1 Tax=Chelativorans salis TaxID=2978478 RepID=A0ABT2LYF1_9HYPH|nr:hypothetical protein [Chelativorans sp. EGI FJ00035]MCT7378628.1 hypothetical protein [Chelativorans sp. EGI FJ00035]